MKTVIVADDSTDFNSQCRNFLTKDNTIKVVQTFNGKDTLEKYKELQPDALILDYKLPKMNGKKVLEKLEEYEKEKNALKRNVVFVTSSAMIDTKLFRNEKIYNFIPKPINNDRVIENIDEIFELNALEQINYHQEISSYLSYLGVRNVESSNYKQLYYTIELVMKNPDLLRKLVNAYYLTGKKYGRTVKEVQNHIQYNVKTIRKYMPKEIQKSVFNIHHFTDKFTPKDFFDKTVIYFRNKKIIR